MERQIRLEGVASPRGDSDMAVLRDEPSTQVELTAATFAAERTLR